MQFRATTWSVTALRGSLPVHPVGAGTGPGSAVQTYRGIAFAGLAGTVMLCAVSHTTFPPSRTVTWVRAENPPFQHADALTIN
jgi:hypothetical protein